jgi:murein DD-endopeptidase MepM/ murein hydrolase activator NlpD
MAHLYNPGSAFTQTSTYGIRTSPTNPNVTEFHPGIDFAAAAGTAIPAAYEGRVVYSGENKAGYGNTVVIRSTDSSGNVFYTMYAHMNGQVMPQVGALVEAGATIGQVGSTGISTGPHLHYEVLAELKSNLVYAPEAR